MFAWYDLNLEKKKSLTPSVYTRTVSEPASYYARSKEVSFVSGLALNTLILLPQLPLCSDYTHVSLKWDHNLHFPFSVIYIFLVLLIFIIQSYMHFV